MTTPTPKRKERNAKSDKRPKAVRFAIPQSEGRVVKALPRAEDRDIGLELALARMSLDVSPSPVSSSEVSRAPSISRALSQY
jgi:hypothetical protein